ncbi:MAG: proline dehydrogenase family protein [Acidimicrobiales bacterium]
MLKRRKNVEGPGIAPPEAEVRALVNRIAELEGGNEAHASHIYPGTEWMMRWAMGNASLRTQMFRFVDVLPAMIDDADLYRHVREYFGGELVPGLLSRAVRSSAQVPAGGRVVAAIARHEVARMATQFIVATDAAGAAEKLDGLWRRGRAATVDLLGEHTHSNAEADRYAARLADLVSVLVPASRAWPSNDVLERDDLGAIGRVAVAIKPTALAPDFAPLTAEAGISSATKRLVPILEAAASQGAQVWFDLERYEVKHVTHRLVRQLLDRPELVGLQAGIVVQTYLKDSYEDLVSLCEWADGREEPVGIRLVKGAYWDTETIAADAAGWPVPVYGRKAETDANFERCVRFLHSYHGRVRAAFGSHNLRSLAYAIAAGRAAGIPDNGYEVQLLWGMAEPVHEAFHQLGFRVRVYAPMGELMSGMAYLVRRLLENTSNEGFVRLRFAEHKDLTTLVAAPRASLDAVDAAELKRAAPVRPATKPTEPAAYAPEPLVRWFAPEAPRLMGAAMEKVRASLGGEVRAVIGGSEPRTGRTIISVDPADPATVVAVADCCGPKEADTAVALAELAFDRWSQAAATTRAGVLFKAADWLRQRRFDLAALEVFEVGKCWDDADADVAEAIDFLEYYGRQGLRLGGGEVRSAPGEVLRLGCLGRGVVAVISPWSSPLAIPSGMLSAALVAGNAVVFKPAEQAPALAGMLVSALREGGLPDGVISFVPGLGGDIGSHLVTHPRVDVVAFTGSKPVGLGILEAATRNERARRGPRRVVTELGGKNAIIVDSDADLDQAVPAAVRSAFGFAGQRCSAASLIITVGPVHDLFLERFVEATRSLAIGPPVTEGIEFGPLIDEASLNRVRGWQDRAAEFGNVVLRRDEVPDTGYFVGPTVVDDATPGSPLATDEIFGPIVAVIRARDFAEGLELANQVDRPLTAGIMSRYPSHIELGAARLKGGDVYVNRAITGATPGRQPFGCHGMSGVESKAGGSDYLSQFVTARVITENTLRQGFAPLDD